MPQFLPAIPDKVVTPRPLDPLLHLSQPGPHVLAVAERAALSPQEQLVEEVHVDKAKELSEEGLGSIEVGVG